jgi:hypothetical protein
MNRVQTHQPPTDTVDPVPQSPPTSKDRTRSPAESNRIRARVKVKVRRRWWKRRRVVVAAAAIGLLFALAVLDAVYVVATAPRELRSARDHLQAGAVALQAGNLSEARTQFTVARDSSARAGGALGQPVVGLIGWLPRVGDNVDAVRSLSNASGGASSAALHLVDAAEAAGWTGDELPSVDSGMVQVVHGLEEAAPDLEAAAVDLDRATAEVRAIDAEALIGPVRTAVVEARATLGEKDDVARTAASLGQLIPPFLGTGGPRTYLVITQNLSESRGSGGFPGDYATLTASEGRLDLSNFADIATLDPVKPIQMPDDYARRYQGSGGLTTFWASNFSPDFPTSAQALTRMWAASGRRPVDGVIAVDPVWMSDVLDAMGPVETPAWPDPITAGNVTTIMSHDTFTTNDSESANEQQSRIGAALWKGVLQRGVPPQPMAEAMALAARERHLQVYSVHPDEEAELRELGASGDAGLSPDAVAVSWFGPAESRVGFFTRKSVDYQISVHDDGSALVDVTTTLENPAPDGPVSILLGDGTDVPVGTDVVDANFYLPTGATYLGGSVPATPPSPQLELGHPVVSQPFEVGPGSSITSHLRYSYPGAVTDGQFRLRLVPLPSLRPDHVTVEIQPPAGVTLTPLSAALAGEGTSLSFDGEPTTSVDLIARVTRG